MTLEAQRARMLAGEMYNDLTPELIQSRERAVVLTNEYNRNVEHSPQEKRAILKQLFKTLGEDVYLGPDFRCEFGFNIAIGDRFYANFDCIILDGASVDIGDDVLFGPRVGIYTANHAIDPTERAAGACYAKPVKIGNRVWIGAGVHIMQGVEIGENTIIGAGSVVTKSIPANVVAAGVPCNVIRPITDQDKSGFQM